MLHVAKFYKEVFERQTKKIKTERVDERTVNKAQILKEGINKQTVTATPFSDDKYTYVKYNFSNDEEMTEIIDELCKYNIFKEYLQLLFYFRANIIDPLSGLPYFPCATGEIDTTVKRVTFVNDAVFRILERFELTATFAGNGIDIKKFMATKNNNYYEMSYMYSFMSLCYLLPQTTDIKKTKTFDDLLLCKPTQTLEQIFSVALGEPVVKDIPRRPIVVYVLYNEKAVTKSTEGETASKTKQFEFYGPTLDPEPKNGPYKSMFTELCGFIRDNVPENSEDMVSKFLVIFAGMYSQVFNALETTMFKNIGIFPANSVNTIQHACIDLVNNSISWTFPYDIKCVMDTSDSNCDTLDCAKSLIVYKCYDYLMDIIYVSSVLILPNNTQLPEINDILNGKKDYIEFITWKASASKTKKKAATILQLSNIVIPTTTGSTTALDLSTNSNFGGKENSVNYLRIKLSGPWTIYPTVFDYIFANQLMGRYYMQFIRKNVRLGGVKLVHLSQLILVADNFNAIPGLAEQFYKNINTSDIRILAVNLQDESTGYIHRVYVLLYKDEGNRKNTKTVHKKRVLFYLDTSSIPYSNIVLSTHNRVISELRTQMEKDGFKLDYIAYKCVTRVEYNVSVPVYVPVTDTYKLFELMSMYAIFNGIESICKRTYTKSLVILNNFDTFFEHLCLILRNWPLFEKKEGRPIEPVNPKNTSNLPKKNYEWLFEGNGDTNSEDSGYSGANNEATKTNVSALGHNAENQEKNKPLFAVTSVGGGNYRFRLSNRHKQTPKQRHNKQTPKQMLKLRNNKRTHKQTKKNVTNEKITKKTKKHIK